MVLIIKLLDEAEELLDGFRVAAEARDDEVLFLAEGAVVGLAVEDGLLLAVEAEVALLVPEAVDADGGDVSRGLFRC